MGNQAHDPGVAIFGQVLKMTVSGTVSEVGKKFK